MSAILPLSGLQYNWVIHVIFFKKWFIAFVKLIFKKAHAKLSFEVCNSRHHKTSDVNYRVAGNISNNIYKCLKEEDYCNRNSRMCFEFYWICSLFKTFRLWSFEYEYGNLQQSLANRIRWQMYTTWDVAQGICSSRSG